MLRPQHQPSANRFGVKAQYSSGQHLDVLRSSGRWDPGVVTDVSRAPDGQIMYRVDVLNEYGYPTGIWKELNTFEAERMLRPHQSRAQHSDGGRGGRPGAAPQNPSSGDPDLDARVERTLRRLEQEKAGLREGAQAAGGGAAPPSGGPAADEEGQDDRIDRRLREIEAKTGKVSNIPPSQQQQKAPPASPGATPPSQGPRQVPAPDGSMMDADLDERLQARLRKTEAMAKQKKEEAGGGKVIHSAEDQQEEIANEGEDPEEGSDDHPDSEQEKWLAEQLGEDIAHEADLEQDMDEAEAEAEAHAEWLAQKQAAGQEVRGICPICGFEVLSDMPRFKIGELYFHEECRAEAVKRGYQCAPPAVQALTHPPGGKGKGKGKGSAAPGAPATAAPGAPATPAVDEEARLRQQVLDMEKEVAEAKQTPASPEAASPAEAGHSPAVVSTEVPPPVTPDPGNASPERTVPSSAVAEAGESPAALSPTQSTPQAAEEGTTEEPVASS